MCTLSPRGHRAPPRPLNCFLIVCRDFHHSKRVVLKSLDEVERRFNVNGGAIARGSSTRSS